MKTKWYNMTGFALAISLGLALQSAGKKPVKPDPEPGFAYKLVNIGRIPDATDLDVSGINDAGSVIGNTHMAPHEVFVIEAFEGTYGPVHLLPSTSGGNSRATDINASGMITTTEYDPDRAVLWIDGSPIVLAEGLAARADGINDFGVVVGSIANVYGDGDQAWVLVPLDSDSNGTPDTWFLDDDADGINDLIMPLTRGYDDIWERYLAIDIKNDGRALVTFVNGSWPYEIYPDFADPDGDGNPWFTDENGDFFNDLMLEFEQSGAASVVAANEIGNAVGDAYNIAAMWNPYSTTDYTELGVVTRRDDSFSYDINNAQWVVGISSGRKGNRGFLYKDGEMLDFGELCGSEYAVATAINNAGVVAGSSGSEVFVGMPSETP